MSNVIREIVEGFFRALLAFLERQAEKPDTIDHVKTPQSVRDKWAAYLRERLRDKDRRN